MQLTCTDLFSWFKDFSRSYSTLPHNVIEKKNSRFKKCFPNALFILHEMAFISHIIIGVLSLPLKQSEIIMYGLFRRCVKLSLFLAILLYLYQNFTDKNVGNSVGLYYVPLVAVLHFYLSWDGHYAVSLKDAQSEAVGIFYSPFRYLGDLMNIGIFYFESIDHQTRSSELR